MKKVILCLAILLLPTLCFAGDSDAERLEAAKRYAAVANFDRMMTDVVANIARTMPEKDAKIYVEFMGSLMEDGAFKKTTVILMAKHFTTEELNTLADFYGTEMGQSILTKFGPYMAETQVVIREFIVKGMEEFKAKRESGELSS
ncbi:DUF2059 domain-containing protein [Salidesulfovibrio onnuriiensis]|uniref:DUF2059 domain-containing protein n=1 Tax=Salidesulfovibrio onnuriiensis TaxID=2583823 RepID=UPI0011CA04FF|nr:DUF2059 domain-containing protein [Salidesulfovibrio onnuriiensis]